MFDRKVCGVELGRCERHECVHFTCPSCGAQHDRGWIGYRLGSFRCMRCGYSGHGLHPDAEIDRSLWTEWEEGNAQLLAAGLPTMPPTWPDPLNGPG
jgi:predicted RNA-binding Zn-ribbon protein involved in translation (DUF1610 family)